MKTQDEIIAIIDKLSESVHALSIGPATTVTGIERMCGAHTILEKLKQEILS